MEIKKIAIPSIWKKKKAIKKTHWQKLQTVQVV